MLAADASLVDMNHDPETVIALCWHRPRIVSVRLGSEDGENP
jgi:hypothetical protein